MPRLIACRLVAARSASCSSTNMSVMPATVGLGLADADRLDDHHVEAGGLAERASPRGSSRPRRPSAPPEGDGRMNAVRCARQLLHARLVAEDRAARDGRRRVDREHRDAVAALDRVQAERLDERRLADARRRPRCRGAARRRVGGSSAVEQRLGRAARWSARVDSTSVMALASARRSPLDAAAASSHRRGLGSGFSAVHVSRASICSRTSRARGGDRRAGAEDARDARPRRGSRSPAAGSRRRRRR